MVKPPAVSWLRPTKAVWHPTGAFPPPPVISHLQQTRITQGPGAALRSNTTCTQGWESWSGEVGEECPSSTSPSLSPSGKHVMAMTYWTATCQALKDDPETRPLPLVLTLKSHARACGPFTKRKLRLREAQHPQVQVRCDHQPAWLFLLLDVWEA